MAPRNYSPEFKAYAMATVERNHCDFRRVSTQTGVSMGTLRRWWLEYQQERAQAQAEADSIDELRRELIENALRLAKELKEANGSVTFSQRATALNQLMDKVIRLLDKLPEEEIEEMIRVAHQEEDFDEDEEDEEADMERHRYSTIASEAKEDTTE